MLASVPVFATAIAWLLTAGVLVWAFREHLNAGYERARRALAGDDAVDRAAAVADIELERIDASLATTAQTYPGRFLNFELFDTTTLSLAQTVLRLGPVTIRRRLDQLAREYEMIRGADNPGQRRTRRLDLVIAKMRCFGQAFDGDASEFFGDSPGRRLVAIAILDRQPRKRHVDWLARRVIDDSPIAGYHAARALRSGARMGVAGDRTTLRTAITRALEHLAGEGANSTRGALLAEALRIVDGAPAAQPELDEVPAPTFPEPDAADSATEAAAVVADEASADEFG